MRTAQFLRVLFFILFFYYKKTCVTETWEVEDFTDLGTTVSNKSYHHLGLSPGVNEPRQTMVSPRRGAANAYPWLSTTLVAGSVRTGREGDRFSQRRS